MTRYRRLFIARLLVLAAVLLPRAFLVSGHAASLASFTDPAAYALAAGALPFPEKVLDFENVAPGTVIASGATVSGITFTSQFGLDFIVDNRFEAVSGQNYLGANDSADNVFITTDSFLLESQNPFQALGMFFLTGEILQAGEIEIATPFGSAFSGADPALSPGAGLDDDYAYFVGVVSSGAAFSSAQIRFRPVDGSENLFNVDGIAATVVPEPSTWALCLTGVALLMAAGRRRSPHRP